MKPLNEMLHRFSVNSMALGLFGGYGIGVAAHGAFSTLALVAMPIFGWRATVWGRRIAKAWRDGAA